MQGAGSLTAVFDDLVRVETNLWNGIDGVLRNTVGTSLGALDVLRVVDRVTPCRIGDIARELSITVGGASQAADRATAAGHIARVQNPEDRRSSVVRLTQRGTELLAQSLVVFESELATRLGGALATGTMAGFATALRALRASDAGTATSPSN